jgi:hypothetical protein
MSVELSELGYEKASEDLAALGYAVVRTPGVESALISAAGSLGRFVGARSVGITFLRSPGSNVWLGRHTETLTDGPVPIRYFALGCLVPAESGGDTVLFDGRKAAGLVLGSLRGARWVRIRYRSQYRPEVADHPLIVQDERLGAVLRFRSESVNNEVVAKPRGVGESELYAAVEAALDASVALAHSWSMGDLLVVDNHTMLHSRAPFMGLRHMLRFRYDDPLHPTVILAG